jgi:hypothetical protein
MRSRQGARSRATDPDWTTPRGSDNRPHLPRSGRDPGCQKSLSLAVAEEGPEPLLRTCQLAVGRDGGKPLLSLPPRSRTACFHS